MKKNDELVFKLNLIDESLEKEQPELKFPKYSPEIPLNTFPICYLEEKEQVKIKDETRVFNSSDIFVSPITGTHINKSVTGAEDVSSLAGYDIFQREEKPVKDKNKIKKDFDLLDSDDYLHMLENGIQPKQSQDDLSFGLDTLGEDLDDAPIDPRDNIAPLYDDSSATYEYIDEEVDKIEVDNTPQNRFTTNSKMESRMVEKSYVDEPISNDTLEELNKEESNFESSSEMDIMNIMEESSENRERLDRTPKRHVERYVEKAPAKMERVLKKRKYIAPSLDFLKYNSGELIVDDAWAQEKQEIINKVFSEFNFGAKSVGYKVGPTVTLFLIDIEPGTDVNKINSFGNTLQMRLKAKSLRIQSPIIGYDYAGIEIANETRTTVLMGNLINNKDFLNNPKKLVVPLGLNVNGEIVYADIEKFPHGLVAGSTGSGKSVCINTMIISLLYKNSPDELRFILIDPKMVELSFYEGIPHLAVPVITEAKKAAPAFKWLCEEMDRRFVLFQQFKVRNLAGYNELAVKNSSKIMPRIIVIIDELADLMLTSGSEIESYVMRLGAKARAAGIHVILATQRPSTDVIKGTMKNNIPTRLAFKVTSPTDSTTIIDHGGAEKLLGNGDMLYKNEFGEERIQGAYVSDEEIRDVTEFLTENYEQEFLLSDSQLDERIIETEDADEEDELFEEIAYFCVRNNTASTNQLQKTFKISFNRADRIVLMMEKLGIVSQTVRGKSREVIVNIDQLNEILDNR